MEDSTEGFRQQREKPVTFPRWLKDPSEKSDREEFWVEALGPVCCTQNPSVQRKVRAGPHTGGC